MECKHETSEILQNFPDLNLTKLKCTYDCGQLFWTQTEGLLTKEIPNDQAEITLFANLNFVEWVRATMAE